MTETEQNILAALRDLEATAARCRTETPPPPLTPIFTRLGELAAQLPPGTNHDLRHYLQRKSYEKARLWLEGVDPEKGTCRK
jgi:hypothetical protein